MEHAGEHPGVCPAHEIHFLAEGGEVSLFKGVLHGPGTLRGSGDITGVKKDPVRPSKKLVPKQ